MPWDDLTEVQQAFLRNYLQSSTWDFIFGAEKSKANKPVIAGFEELERIESEYRDLIGGIPDDYPERIAIEDGAAQAKGLREAGDFAGAGKILSGAVADIGKTVTTLRQAAADLRKTPKPVIAGAKPEEVDEIDRLHREMMEALADEIPTRAEMTAARDKGGELGRAADRIDVDVARRKKAREDFDAAVKLVKPTLERVAAEKPEAWAQRMQNYGEVEAAIDGAAQLLQEVNDADASEDEADHVAATEKLTEWNKTAGEYDDLIEASRNGIEEALRNAYAVFEADLDENSNLNLAAYPEADEKKLTPLMAQLAKDRTAILDALSGGDPAEQLRQYDDLDTVKDRLTEFQRLREIARDNRQQNRLVASGVSQVQATRIAKMRQASPEVVESINTAVDEANKVIGGIEVTTKVVEDHKKLREGHLKDWRAAGEKIASVDKQIEKATQDAQSLIEKVELQFPGVMSEGDEGLKKLDPADVEELERLVLLKTNLDNQKKVAQGERSEAENKWREENNFVGAAEKKKRLLDAVTFGPLSPDRSNPLDPGDVKKLVDLYQQDWEVADHAVETVGKAKNPESVIAAVDTLAGRLATNMGNPKWSKETAQKYANNVITMSGSLPFDVVNLLDDYLNQGGHLAAVPDVDKGGTFEDLAKSRTAHVAKYMVRSDGSLDIDAAMYGLCDVAFHPDSVRNGTPVVAGHMYETIEYFKNSPTAEDKIKAITLPTDPGALSLLSKGSGEPVGSITEETSRQQVVNAMLTPVYQGEIGSCFATAGVLRMRQTDPDRALELYSDLATKGTFTPKNPDPSVVPVPVPAILNVPSKDNPLVRSLEFTVGTAAAIDQDSYLNSASASRSAKSVEKVKGKIKPAEWNKVKAKLKRAIPGAFTFSYNADVDIVGSSDGSSTKGGYELISKADNSGIKTEDDYVRVITPIVIAQIEASDMASGVTEATIRDLVKSREFLDELKIDGKMPWQLSSGGASTEATKVLEGKTVTRNDFLPKFAPTEDMDLRTQAVVESLLTAFDGVTDDLAPIETGGMHTFNALPQHPSLAKLTQGGSGSIATNFTTEVLDKGTALKNTDIPVEKAALMVEKQLRALAKNAGVDAKKALEDAILVHRPTTAMKPAALKALMKTACTDYVNAFAKAEADAWKKAEKEKTGVEPGSDAYNAKEAEWKKYAEKEVEGASSTVLVSELDAPQFVIADSNWGGPRSRTLFVLCPDPETGKPRMFEQTDPGGDLKPMGEDWLKTNWLRVK